MATRHPVNASTLHDSEDEGVGGVAVLILVMAAAPVVRMSGYARTLQFNNEASMRLEKTATIRLRDRLAHATNPKPKLN